MIFGAILLSHMRTEIMQCHMYRRCSDHVDCGPALPPWINDDDLAAVQCFADETSLFRRVYVPFSLRGKKNHENRKRLKFILRRIFERSTFTGVARASKNSKDNSAVKLYSIAQNVLKLDFQYFTLEDKTCGASILSLESRTTTVRAVSALLDMFLWTARGLMNKPVIGSRFNHWINRTHMRTLSTRASKIKEVRDSVLKEAGWEKCAVLSKVAVATGDLYTVEMECGKRVKIIQVYIC